MIKIQYNKLVRDRIPEIIERTGNRCVVEILNKADYLIMIDKKLDEELAEYHNDKNLEELADLLEVIYAVTEAREYTIDQLEERRIKKQDERGAFKGRILLKEVIEK